MDDTDQQAQNNSAVEESSQATSPVDETTNSSSNESVETEAESSSAEETSEETKPQSHDDERKPTRSERRIRDLVEQNKRLQAQNQVPQGFQQPPQLNVQPPDPGQEFNSYEDYAQKYQTDVVQAANSIAALQTQQQLQQFAAQQNLDRDADVLPTQYPELNPDSEEYTPEVIDAIEEEFKERAFVNGQLNPSVRLADIAKRHVKVARAAAKKSSSTMRNSIARTADTTALRPTQNNKTEKSAADMSIEELEAKIGFAQQ